MLILQSFMYQCQDILNLNYGPSIQIQETILDDGCNDSDNDFDNE